MRKLYILLLTVLLVNALQAQVSVTATAGTLNASYTTLKGAFDAINTGTHQGVITIFINGNTTETATAVLNSGSVAPASYIGVTITPTVPSIISGTIAGAVIKLNGADNVIIDGSIGGTGTDRSLTIQNNSTASGTAAIWLASVSVTDGCTGNTISSLEIKTGIDASASNNTTFGIIMCGATLGATSNGTGNDFNTFRKNRITKCRYGIVTRGTNTDLNQGTIVTLNEIGDNAFGPNQVAKTGILMQADQDAVVSRNIIQYIGGPATQAQSGADRNGIAIGTDSWSTSPGTLTGNNYSIVLNVIHDVVEEKTFSAVGINLSTTGGGSATNNLVANNFIYNVRANATGGDQTAGIGIAGGHSDKVVYNSIYLGGDVDPGSAAACTSYGSGIRIANTNGTTHANLTLVNNIVHIDLSSSSTPGVRFYAISGPDAAYSFGAGGQNYNDYYINPANTQLRTGGIGNTSGNTLTTQFASLANWQTAYATNQDGNSIQADPGFLSTTDLHINTAIPAVDGKATLVSGVFLDIDGDTRNNATPDIGADEYTSTAQPCVTPPDQATAFTAGTITSTSVAGSFTPAVSTPSGYIVIRSIGAFSGTLVNGTTYGPGTVLGNGTVVQASSSTTFNSSGLTGNTAYTFTIAAYNTGTCVGGPVYNTANMLTGNRITCPQTPGSLTTTAITGNAFTLSWASSAGGNALPVTYTAEVATDAAFTTPVAGSPFTINDPVVSQNITGLGGATTYYYRVTASNGCNSAFASGNVTTTCTAYTPAYLEPFTTYLPSCWTEQTGNLNTAPTALTGTTSEWTADGWLNAGTTGAAKINLFFTGKRDWLISPSIDLGAAGNYQLEFDVATMEFGSSTTASVLGSDDSLAVVISTDNGATWTNTNILALYTAANTPLSATGLHVTVPLSTYTGLVKIGFYGSEGTINDIQDVDVMIDNVAVNPIPACGAINGLAVTNITGTSAVINWNVTPGAAGYQYAVTTSPAPPPAGTTIAANNVTATGLTGSTQYYAHVRSDCGGGAFGNWNTISFTTSLVNDDAPGAIPITLGTCSGNPFTNLNATQAANEPNPSCKSSGGFNTVWYKFIAPASGMVKISNDYSGGTQGPDTRLALFSATDVNDYSTFTILACDDDNGVTISSRSVIYMARLVPGNTYYVQVSGYSSSTIAGTFCLSVEELNSSMISSVTACTTGQSLATYNNNYNGWVSAVDNTGKLMFQLRNSTGAGAATSTYTISQHINAGPVRNNAATKYLDRNYFISNNSVNNADVQFFFRQTELNALNAADPTALLGNLGVVRQGGATCAQNFATANGATAFLPQSFSATTADGNAALIQVQTPSFSNFYIQSNAVPILPVNLLTFAGQRSGTVNKLRWTTATEQNNRGFEIQRSADGVNFSAIGFVNTLATGGNSTSELHYTFTDNNPGGAKQYYRLRQVDMDNHSRLSNMVYIKGERPATLAVEGIYPNPASTELNVIIATPVHEKLTLLITDITGKSVLQKTAMVEAGSNTIPVDISRLTKGSYVVKLVCESNCENAAGKFVKQ